MTSRPVPESIRAFSTILNAFELNEHGTLLVKRGPGEAVPYAHTANEAAGTPKLTAATRPLFDADTAITNLCAAAFAEEYTEGRGALTYPTSANTIRHPSPLDGGAIYVVPGMVDDVRLTKAVIFSCLYSRAALFVLPLEISDLFISYSGANALGMRKPWTTIERLLNYNKRIEPLVLAGKCAFVPRVHSYGQETTSEYWIRRYNAPTHQDPERISGLPLNAAYMMGPVLHERARTHSHAIAAELVLPCFDRVEYGELLRIAENETDAFVKFNHFLSLRLAGLNQARSAAQIAQILEEVHYETANLRQQAEKLAKLKSLQAAQLVFFTLSLGVVTLTEASQVKELAGILGSVSLIEVLKGYFGYQREKFDLKKSDFYLPYLFTLRK